MELTVQQRASVNLHMIQCQRIIAGVVLTEVVLQTLMLWAMFIYATFMQIYLCYESSKQENHRRIDCWASFQRRITWPSVRALNTFLQKQKHGNLFSDVRAAVPCSTVLKPVLLCCRYYELTSSVARAVDFVCVHWGSSNFEDNCRFWSHNKKMIRLHEALTDQATCV